MRHIGVLVILFLALAPIPPAHADEYGCSCVTYVQKTLKTRGYDLPGGLQTAGEYQEGWMKGHGWVRVVPPNNGTIPSGGKPMVMIWDPSVKGAYPAGHMALTNGDPHYDQGTKKWVVRVNQVDWKKNCSPSSYTFTGVMDGGNWGDLYGINFYVPRK